MATGLLRAAVALPALVMALSGQGSARAADVAAAIADETAERLPEIVVTAQRRGENLQNVPIAVSVFTSKTRDLLGINTIQDIANFTPGLTFQDSPNRLSIRGIGRQTNALGSDPGVAVYVDGIYTSEASPVGNLPIFIQRIEVLRGPQGTLFGRNSIGGAINTISRRPSKTWTSEMRLTVASFDTVTPNATISGPITDGIRVRLGGFYDYAGKGYVTNANGGPGFGTRDDYFLEAQIEADVGSHGLLWLKYNNSSWERSAPIAVQLDPNITTNFFPAGSLVPNANFGDPTPNPGVTNPRRVNLDDQGFVRLRNSHSITGQFDYDFGGVQFKYLGNYQQFDYTSENDADNSNRKTYNFFGYTVGSQLRVLIGDSKRTFSNEVTFSGSSDKFKWIVGAFQYREKESQPFEITSINQPQLLVPLVAATFQPAAANPAQDLYFQRGEVRSNSWAGFAQGDLKLGNVTVTAGVRYTRDIKTGTEVYRLIFWEPFTLAGINPAVALCCSLDVTPANNTRTLRRSFGGFTGRLAAAWQVDTDTLIYGSVSNGYKSGGFNLGQVAPNAIVNPEQVTAFEIGSKLQLGNTLRLNTAAFYNIYYSQQVLVSAIRNGITQQDFVNARRSRSLGFEAEALWTPTKNITISGNYSYLDAKFTDFPGQQDVTSATPTLLQNLAGNRLPLAPRHRLAVNAGYGFAIGDGRLSANVTYAYVAERFFGPFSTRQYRGPASDQTDFRMSYDSKRFTIIAFAKNAFNTLSYNALGIGTSAGLFPRGIVPSPPRTFGIELQARFE
jgi:iron complex outermembrane receptor protein